MNDKVIPNHNAVVANILKSMLMCMLLSTVDSCNVPNNSCTVDLGFDYVQDLARHFWRYYMRT